MSGFIEMPGELAKATRDSPSFQKFAEEGFMARKNAVLLTLLVAMCAALLLAAGPGCIIIWKDEGSLNGEPVLHTSMAEEHPHVTCD